MLPSSAEDFDRLRSLLRALAAIGEFSPRTQDLVASYGEVLSSLIFTHRLRQLGTSDSVDAAPSDCHHATFGQGPLRLRNATGGVRLEEVARLISLRPCRRYGGLYRVFIRITTTLGRGAPLTCGHRGAAMSAEGNSDLDGCRRHDDRGSADRP